MIRMPVQAKGTVMKKTLILSLFLAILATTGATCKKEEPVAPPTPEESSIAPAGETGAAAPANDEGGMGEAADVKDDGQTHED